MNKTAASDILQRLDRLSLDDVRKLDAAALRKFEALAHHWASLARAEMSKPAA